MEIGKEDAPFILEPNELPAPLERPAAPEPERTPEKTPEKKPEREKVPA